VEGGEKVGVCGRTGSGKSTLMLALLRLVEGAEGGIEVDGWDIKHVPLQTLRNKVGTQCTAHHSSQAAL
jgi:ABC-type multidrug transport system fused ATPase/permease subunit